MSWRTVIISNQAKLDYRMGYLVVRGEKTSRVLIDEISALVIENPAVSLTGCLLVALNEKKVRVIFCDEKRNPFSELFPYYGSFDCSAKLREQMKWSDAEKDFVWREIVREKIRQQASFLRSLGREEKARMLEEYYSQVVEGDLTNREGHAAKVYFNELFGMSFSRGAPVPINAALNYGYSLILSTVNREVSINGYLTQLGIFHDNMFNPFNLSCDLMEPFRILVDRAVFRMHPEEFDSEEKHTLWTILDQRVVIDGTTQQVRNAIRIYCRSVFDALNNNEIADIRFFDIMDE